jgi:hypothetical protein
MFPITLVSFMEIEEPSGFYGFLYGLDQDSADDAAQVPPVTSGESLAKADEKSRQNRWPCHSKVLGGGFAVRTCQTVRETN